MSLGNARDWLIGGTSSSAATGTTGCSGTTARAGATSGRLDLFAAMTSAGSDTAMLLYAWARELLGGASGVVVVGDVAAGLGVYHL